MMVAAMRRLVVGSSAMLLVATAAFIVGCGDTRYRNYNNPSAGQSEFDRDRYACERENTVLIPRRTAIGSYTDSSFDSRAVNSCMAARGWRPVSKDDPQLQQQQLQPQNDTEAVALFRKAAEQGNADAQNTLGWMYREGRGVPQSDTEAVAWFRKAAEQGNALGQNNLGLMYMERRGVPQNDTEAVAWFRKAAEQGNGFGQSNLGLMYRAGRGVPQSDTEAVALFRKSADQGFAGGLAMLGVAYADGRGVSKDEAKALTLLQKACDMKDQQGCQFYQRLQARMSSYEKQQQQLQQQQVQPTRTTPDRDPCDTYAKTPVDPYAQAYANCKELFGR